MSGSELAAVIVAVASGVALTVLLLVVVALLRTIRELRVTVEALRTESIAVIKDLHETVRGANAELERVDRLLQTAESVSGTVDSASRLAYLAMGNPVVKILAFATGVSRAFRRFRGRKQP